jgi:acyl-CoA synthetase (AMP-forming)/AMP-acid ligase II
VISLAALREPGRIALRDQHSTAVSYAQLERRTNRLASALFQHGLTAGDRIAVWSDTRVPYVELYLAAAKAGMVVVAVNSMFTWSEAAWVLGDSGATALFYAPAVAPALRGHVEAADFTLLAGFGPDADCGGELYEELVDSGADESPPPPPEDALYLIGYTSGTTGRPKGAMFTHRAVKTAMRQIALMRHTETFAVHAFHTNMSFVAAAVSNILPYFLMCGTVVLTGRTDVAGLADIVAANSVTDVYIPTPWLEEFVGSVQSRPDLWRSLRTIMHGGSKATPELVRSAALALGSRFIESWGLTENSGISVCATTSADFEGGFERQPARYASVGRPAPETLVVALDSGGSPLPADGRSIGELAIASPTLMSGYWNNAAATAAAFHNGMFRSGDLGCLDSDGYVYILDRRVDLIVSGGMNVYPSEIEQVLAQVPGIGEFVVVAGPHERWGQTPVVVIEGAEGRCDVEKLWSVSRQHLARYKQPTAVTYLPELPRTTSGKIMRRVVQEQLAARDG